MEGGKETRGLTPELIEKARVELNEVQSQVPDRIRALREEILKDPTKNFRTDDAFLLRFLRARKFNKDRALESMTNYYKHRDKYPKFFKRTTADVASTLSSKTMGVLAARDRNGCPIVLYNIRHWNPALATFEDTIANFALTLECLVEYEDVQINGVVLIGDMKGLTVQHLLNMNPLTVKRTVESLLNSFPLRYKAIHYVNEPKIFDALWLLIKPFLMKKLLNRVKFHGGSLGSLHEFFSPDTLPEELGGNFGPYDNSEWNRILEAHQNTMKKNLKFGFRKSLK